MTSSDAPTSARDAPPGWGGKLGRVLLALTTFVLAGLLLRAVAAPSGGGVIGGKLEYWARHGREFDTVFLGTSHVFRAFVPAEFDRRLAEAGIESRSFNFGVQAVHLIEARHLLKEILDQSAGKLARVFFEYQWLTPQIDPQNSFAARTVYWHDWDSTRLALERSLHWGGELGADFRFAEPEAQQNSLFSVADRCLPSGVRVAKEHLQHYLMDRFLIGRGKDVAKGVLGREHGQTARYAAERGYLSLEEEESVQGGEQNSYRARRARFLEEQEAYRAGVEALGGAGEVFGDEEWVNAALQRVDDFELVRLIADEAERRGVQFVLVILPSQSANRPFEERLERELGAPVLRYNLPERYPELYAPENRYDSGHLSAAGARAFTALLARDYSGLASPAPATQGGAQGGESVQ